MEKAMKKITLFVLGAAIVIIQSCSNKKTSESNDGSGDTTTRTTTQSNTPTTADDTTTTALFTSHEFPVLYIEWTSIQTVFEEAVIGNRKKLVFRYEFTGAGNQPTLGGFPATNNGNYTSNTAPVINLTASTVTFTIATPFYLGNIELSREEFRSLKRDPNKLRYLLFIPVKSEVPNITNVVTYATQWSDIIPASKAVLRPTNVGDELNPSPPRNPE